MYDMNYSVILNSRFANEISIFLVSSYTEQSSSMSTAGVTRHLFNILFQSQAVTWNINRYCNCTSGTCRQKTTRLEIASFFLSFFQILNWGFTKFLFQENLRHNFLMFRAHLSSFRLVYSMSVGINLISFSWRQSWF